VKTEGRLFAVVAAFFAVTGGIYDYWAKEPAGKAALAVAFLMSSLISFFFFIQYVRRGKRAQDRKDSDIAETAGRLDFFPPSSGYPVLTAAGAALTGTGIALGMWWLFLIGAGLLFGGVYGFIFQYRDR
jgi:hypothetical protein